MSPEEKIAKIMDLFNEVKIEIRNANESFYERWKAGGFLVDPNVHSMYPSLSDAAHFFEDDLDSLDDEGWNNYVMSNTDIDDE